MRASERALGFFNSTTAKFVIPAFAVLAVAYSAAAQNEPFQSGVTTVSKRLVYRDLDLSTPQGAHLLVARVEAAAQNLCSPLGPRLTGGPSVEEFRCRDQATERAIAQLESPLVSAAYARQGARRSQTQAVAATTP